MIRSGSAPPYSQPRSVSAKPSYSPSSSGSSEFRSSTRTTTLSISFISSGGTSSSASATSASKTGSGSAFTGRSPARRQRAALLVAGRALHPQHRALVQLVDAARPGVGAGRADTGHDPVDQVLDAGAGRVEVHPGGADALLEQPGPGAVEAALRGGAGPDRAGRGHPEALLVPAAVPVVVQVAGALVGAGEPGADHHVRRAGGQRQGHVARVPHAAVGPDVPAQLARGGGALLDRGELRAPDAGHHPGGAHGA